MKLDLKMDGRTYEWNVKDTFLMDQGLTLEIANSMSIPDLILNHDLMKNTHNESGPAVILYINSKVYKLSYWVNGLVLTETEFKDKYGPHRS